MRTPNTTCIICDKPLYRRPGDMAKARYAACMMHRAIAQSVVGVTEKQAAGLSCGRVKGDNRRKGYKHREESKHKVAESNRLFWAMNPELAVARGSKMRAEHHYLWKGGISRLNTSIRQMCENRRWMDGIKKRDNYRCVRCGSQEKIESHHIKGLGRLISELCIKSRDDARAHADRLWNLANGETLCTICHYTEHNRRMAA